MRGAAWLVIGACTAAFVGGCAASSAGPEPAEESVSQSEQAWEAMSPTNESESTHLFVVARAVDILARHPELPSARVMKNLMSDATCRARWQAGLYDADWYAQYNDNGAWFPNDPLVHDVNGWKSHFYDPDTRKNFAGETKPTARTQAALYWGRARAAIDKGDLRAGCYDLGLALHYVTDVTQPMHAANFTAKSPPLLLHSHLEGWSMEIQNDFVAQDWTATPPSGDPDAALVANARRAKAGWVGMRAAINDAYVQRCGVYVAFVAWVDNGYEHCWKEDPGVRAETGGSIRQAQIDTAGWLYTLPSELRTADRWR
jgi:hypothetical protein